MVKNLEKIKIAVLPILKKNNVKKAAIFGSVATGKEKKHSDVDILIEFRGRRTIYDLSALYSDLEAKLKRKVDLVTYNSIDSRFRKSILSNKVDIL